ASASPAGALTLWGWATVRNSTTSYALPALDHHTSAGSTVNVQHLGTGSYAVLFKGIGNDGGTAQVNALGNSRLTCEVAGFSRASVATKWRVTVRCFAPSGANANSPFTLAYLSASSDVGPMAYLWSSGLGTETANAQYSFASNGGAMTITRVSVGFYTVK